MIYFVQDLDSRAIKIGLSYSAGKRRKQLESEYKRPLRLLGVRPGDRNAERLCHAFFAECAVEGSEWHRPTSELIDFIRNRTYAWDESFDGTDEWQIEAIHVPVGPEVAWLARLGEHAGVGFGRVINEAIRVYAESVGFAEPRPDSETPIDPKQLHVEILPEFPPGEEPWADEDDEDDAEPEEADEPETVVAVAAPDVRPTFAIQSPWG